MPSFTQFRSILDFLILSLFRHVSTVLLRFIRPSLTEFDEIVEQPGNWDREARNPGHGYPSAQLYWIVADNETLQPSKQQVESALEQSREYWHHVASVAEFRRDHGINSEAANPHYMLQKVPRMRGWSHNPYTLYLGASPTPALCLRASATWRLDESTKCERIQKERTQNMLLQIGTKAAITYTLDNRCFSCWTGAVDETVVGPNYLAILTLGWCYILSSRLVEIQSDGAIMRYTASKAIAHNTSCHDAGLDAIDIGEADGSMVSWWSAILAPGEGWRAIVKHRDDGEFLAPWSLRTANNPTFSVKWQGSKSERPCYPPLSSNEAFHLLSQFAIWHNLGSQFSIAFAAALTVPTHQYHGTTFQLPRPKSTTARCPGSSTTSIPPEWSVLYENLDYYMSLSCKPEAIISLLCGTFWEPGVPCNVASPWLHPILNDMPEQHTDFPEIYAEKLALIGGIRRPSISALWLGAVVGGITPIILRRTRLGRPPLDPVAFAWTGSPQSFMDVTGTGPYLVGQSHDKIWRSDVWRLLYLPTTDDDELSYNYWPGSPWEPCGKMVKENCALRVTSHLHCERHHFDYHHWTWEATDSAVVEDQGLSAASTPSFSRHFPQWVLPLRALGPRQQSLAQLDQEASREASLEIFRWFVINGEGSPPEKIYNDEWLESLEDEEDSDDEGQLDNMDFKTAQEEKQDGLEKWLDTT